jgi:FkbM family methyltransferase
MAYSRDYRPLTNGTMRSALLDVALDTAGTCLAKMKPLKPLYKMGYQMGQACAELLSRATRFRTSQEDPLRLRMQLLTRTYEANTVELVRRITRPGMVALDIGANVGYYTRLLSTLVESSGHVLAFEPHPRSFALLRQNTVRLNNISLIEMAVGHIEGRATLYDFLSESGGSSLRYDARQVADLRAVHRGQALAPRIVEDLPTATYSVKTTSVDSYLSERHIREVNIVKIDIEGAELDALRGMEEIVQRSKQMAMFIELNPRTLRQFDSGPLELWSKLCDMNFEIMAINRKGRLTPLTNRDSVLELAERIHGHVNLLCTKK